MLLGSTAAVALSMAQPTSAITINDQVAAAAGGIENYYDKGNQFPAVVSLFGVSGPETGSQCTGTLINSRTILTAAHCYLPNRFESLLYRSPRLPAPAIRIFAPSRASTDTRISFPPTVCPPTSPSSPSRNP
jgi:subtilase-type serine protease